MKAIGLLKLVFQRHLLILWLCIPTLGFAQHPMGIVSTLQQQDADKGIITIKHDPSIDQLLNAYYVQNASRPGMQGYRIRIYFDSAQQSRAKSEEVMNEFMENNPGESIYRTFDSPYYKVSVGDFRTRDEALKYLKSLISTYPKAFIIQEWINFPRIEQ